MNKKAIQLSINFLVIIILSIVMLSSGLVLVRKFFATTVDIKADLDTQTKGKISQLLSVGETTALPFNKKTINAGENGVFGLGILNVLREEHQYRVNIVAWDAYDKNKNQLTGFDGMQSNTFGMVEENKYVLYEDTEFTLKPNEQKEIPILVSMPKESQRGTYIFNVIVQDLTQGSQYGNTQKKYVTVL